MEFSDLKGLRVIARVPGVVVLCKVYAHISRLRGPCVKDRYTESGVTFWQRGYRSTLVTI